MFDLYFCKNIRSLISAGVSISVVVFFDKNLDLKRAIMLGTLRFMKMISAVVFVFLSSLIL